MGVFFPDDVEVLDLNGPKGEMSNPWHMQIINRRRSGLISLVAGLGLVVVGAGRLIETACHHRAITVIRAGDERDEGQK